MQPKRRLLQAIAWVAIATFASSNALAGPISLATAPLVTGLGKTVSPNIFFILDDSGSMDYDYMPDSISSDRNKMCFQNYGHNTIYYNPNTTYDMPKNSNGTDRSYVPSFTSALPDGYASSGYGNSPVDLSTTSPVYSDTTGPITALNSNPLTTSYHSRNITVKHSGHGRAVGDSVTLTGLSGYLNGVNLSALNGKQYTINSVTTNTYTFSYSYWDASRANSSGTGGGSGISDQFTYQIVVGSTPDYYYAVYSANPGSPPSTCESDSSYVKTGLTTAAEQQNFAIWYSYYRTRLLMMKSASGRAFASVTDQYRVGFTTISEKGTGSSKFLDINKFDSTQKGDWYTMLYGINAGSYTPLRGALSKAGRYYAGKFDDGSGNHDPVQYSCQKNFTILTTDGFWNTNDETNSYGPYEIDNSTQVGDQDGGSGVARPYYDSSGADNTLADIAYYYYNTDLRPSPSTGGLLDDGTTRLDVSTNNVPTSNTDPAAFQHMTTFTLGLGLNGTLSNPGDYASLVSGTKNWPDPISYSSNRDIKRIDDLWHAAVNGHGTDANGGNFNAGDPDAVVSALSKALKSITAVVGSASAAATSNLQPVNGDNTAFIAQYKTVAWTGDVVARTIDVVTGAIPTTNDWSAQALLDAQSSRNIYTFNNTSGTYGHRRDFTYANLTNEISAGYFKADSGNPGGALAQYSTWNLLQKTTALDQNLMINYIRGVRTDEDQGTGAVTDLFRQREHVLGDIVSAAPVFVRKPPFAYTDPGYATFLANQQSRAPTVYVGANDGMLHAFDGSTGQSGSGAERWAYIPKAVVPNLYKLADSDYSTNHRFYVDGPIAVGDAYNSSSSTWSTILVGGLGGGGMGYYALDVTDPSSPKVLWEFSNTADYSGDTSYDPDMGYSYGNPILTKRDSDGRWVVLFASGYNNNGSGSDKRGHLFVVDAFTGAELSDIATTTTANEDLSGIARISNYVEDGLKNNTTQYVYGGDLNGSLWRFDINAGTVQAPGGHFVHAGGAAHHGATRTGQGHQRHQQLHRRVLRHRALPEPERRDQLGTVHHHGAGHLRREGHQHLPWHVDVRRGQPGEPDAGRDHLATHQYQQYGQLGVQQRLVCHRPGWRAFQHRPRTAAGHAGDRFERPRDRLLPANRQEHPVPAGSQERLGADHQRVPGTDRG